MELREAILQRRSIRGFLKKGVSRDTLEEVLKLAQRAVSSKNSQPWLVHVVTGDLLQKLGADNVARLRRGEPTVTSEVPLSGVYRQRQVNVGKQLFGVMDIQREDKEKRDAWTERGYRFFDAPAVILVCMEKSLSDAYRFDLGCFVQNLCVAAMEYGLGTCVEYQAVYYENGLREYLALPEEQIPVVGIAIGYPDPTFPANAVITEREALENFVCWYGDEKK
ncbi:MAG: nitroreductase [Oscillospiraceae bacterium]|nr:nitroreductase [Oscillospiraceae bacterium]